MMSSEEFLWTRVSVLILFFVTASNAQGGADDPHNYQADVPGAVFFSLYDDGIPAAPYDVGNQGTGQGQGSSDLNSQDSRPDQAVDDGGIPAAPYVVSNQGIGQGQGSSDLNNQGSKPDQAVNDGGVPAAPDDVGNQGIGQGQGSPGVLETISLGRLGQTANDLISLFTSGGGSEPVAPNDVSNQGVRPAIGEWSQWSIWQMCSVTCGEGIKLRERRCGAPGSKEICIGQIVVSEKCQETPICQDGTFIQELYVLPFHTVVLNCYGKRYMRDHPAASVVWYRNDSPVQLRGSLDEGSTFNQMRKIVTATKYIVNTADLKMTYVHMFDEGIYACAIFVPDEEMPTYSTVILLKVNQTSDLLDAGHLQTAKLLWPICLPLLLILTAACSMKVEIKRYKIKGMPPEVVEEIKQRKLENKRKKEEAKREKKLQKKAGKHSGTAAPPPPPPAAGGGGAPPPPAPHAQAPPPPPQPGAAPPPPPPGPPGPAAPGPPPPPGPPMMAPGPPTPAAPQHEMVPTPMALMMKKAPPSFGAPPGPPPPGPPMAPPPGPSGPPMAPPPGPSGPPMAPPPGPSGPPMAPPPGPSGPPMAPPPGPSGPAPPPPGGGGGGPPPPPPPPPR